MLHRDRYREPERSELDGMQTDMAGITARGDWAQTLARYFASGGGMEAREVGLQKMLVQQGLTPNPAAVSTSSDTDSESVSSESVLKEAGA